MTVGDFHYGEDFFADGQAKSLPGHIALIPGPKRTIQDMDRLVPVPILPCRARALFRQALARGTRLGGRVMIRARFQESSHPGQDL